MSSREARTIIKVIAYSGGLIRREYMET